MDKCLQHSCQFLHSRVSCRKQFAGRIVARPAVRQTRSSVEQLCNAGMGMGFTDGLILPRTSQPQIETPPNSYGLSIRQMAALGLSDDSIAKPLEANEVCRPLHRQLGNIGLQVCRLNPDILLLNRNQSQPRHAIAQTRCTKTPESPPEWVLAQEQPQGKLLLTCPPFCWTAASATLACL